MDDDGREQMEVEPGKHKHKYMLVYQGAKQYQYSRETTVVFQTQQVTVELRNSSGTLIENSSASLIWRPYGSRAFVAFGDGLMDADGRESMEVLSGNHKFGITYQGAKQYQYSRETTVVFQTRLVTVELRDSSGALIENSGASLVWRPYGSSTFVSFGDGLMDAGGRESMEVLSGKHKFGITYQGAKQYQYSCKSTVLFQTQQVTVKLRNRSGALIENSGASLFWRPYGSRSYVAFGNGELGASGQVHMEVLAGKHKYKIIYQGRVLCKYSKKDRVIFVIKS